MQAMSQSTQAESWIIQNVLKDYRREARRNDRCVMFVHGVTGDIESTWRAKDATFGFIDLIRQDENLQDYDIFSFGYRTTYFRGAPINNAARQLAGAIDQLEGRYQIVLIAHSMGGLVCMRYILDQLQNGK